MFLGYSPTLIDFSLFLNSDVNLNIELCKSGTNVEMDSLVQELARVQSRKSDFLDSSRVALAFQNDGIAEDSEANWIFSFTKDHDEKCSSYVCKDDDDKKSQLIAHNKQSSNKSVSPLKIISRGEFSGSKFVKSAIVSNFYADARRLGVPANVVDGVISALSSKIDFRRSLKKGDKFEIMYDKKNVMLYAKITAKCGQATVYRVANGTNFAYYFDNGVKVAQKSDSRFFGQPLRGRLHVTSNFGGRAHPVRGSYHWHTGVDLKASHGDPIYAIYDGVVTRASSYYGYGNCVDIAHNSGYKSRYGHLSRYAVRCGMRVKKRQIIGYIGSTGTSTGPHLHLELARNNKVLNPLSVKMMPSEDEMIPNMKKFKALKTQIERISAAK
jgi:murein DD-endopeptidase MepM/ murein hydrolase activator NlpD